MRGQYLGLGFVQVSRTHQKAGAEILFSIRLRIDNIDAPAALQLREESHDAVPDRAAAHKQEVDIEEGWQRRPAVGLAGAVSVAVSNDRRNVYAAAEGSNAVAAFLRDKKTGALTQLPGAAACTSESGTAGLCADGTALVEARAVAVTRNGRSAYVASSTSDAVAAFERD